MAWFPCNLNSDLGGKLLWTNSSPTSEFSAQTISLNLSEYEGVIVELTNCTSDTTIISRPFVKKTDGDDFGGGYIWPATGVGGRNISVTDTGVTFTTGRTQKGSSNTDIIPYKIYGINLNLPS